MWISINHHMREIVFLTFGSNNVKNHKASRNKCDKCYSVSRVCSKDESCSDHIQSLKYFKESERVD